MTIYAIYLSLTLIRFFEEWDYCFNVQCTHFKSQGAKAFQNTTVNYVGFESVHVVNEDLPKTFCG